MKFPRSAVVLLALSATALAQSSVQMKVRLTQPDGSPLRLSKNEEIQIHVQVMDESGGTPKEASPNENGEINFSVTGSWQTRAGPAPVVYRLRVVSSDYEEATLDKVVPAQGDRIVSIPLRRKGESDSRQRPSNGSMVSLGALKVPDKAKKEWEKGNSALTSSDLKGAAEHFQKAIEIYPEYDSAYNNLGVVRMQQGDVEGARTDFQKAAALNEHFARAYVNLGKLAMQEKKYAEADGFLRKSLQSDPTNPEALFFAAEAALIVGRFEDSANDVRVLHTLAHEKYALGHYVAAKALEASNKSTEAVAEYQLFLKEAPDSPQAGAARKSLETLQAQMKQAKQ